jgi:hypothetical protein
MICRESIAEFKMFDWQKESSIGIFDPLNPSQLSGQSSPTE